MKNIKKLNLLVITLLSSVAVATPLWGMQRAGAGAGAGASSMAVSAGAAGAAAQVESKTTSASSQGDSKAASAAAGEITITPTKIVAYSTFSSGRRVFKWGYEHYELYNDGHLYPMRQPDLKLLATLPYANGVLEGVQHPYDLYGNGTVFKIILDKLPAKIKEVIDNTTNQNGDKFQVIGGFINHPVKVSPEQHCYLISSDLTMPFIKLSADGQTATLDKSFVSYYEFLWDEDGLAQCQQELDAQAETKKS